MNAATHIHIKGAREHNLRNLELRIPRGKLVVLTGPSGSGKLTKARTWIEEAHKTKFTPPFEVRNFKAFLGN